MGSMGWSSLPRELQLCVARSLDSPRDVLAFATSAKSFRSLADCDEVWKRLCTAKFGVAPDADPEPPSWRELYIFNHEVLYRCVLRNTVNVLRDLRIRPGSGLLVQMP